MPLQDIEILIRNQVGKNSKVLDAVLGQILIMLKQSNGGKNMESLLQALTYIGAMPVVTKGFLSSPKVVPLIAKLEQQKEIDAVFDRDLLIKMRTPTANVFKPPKEPLSNEEQKILKEIYIAVRREYRKPVWSYSYSREVFDEALNAGWDVQVDQALRDFARGVKIEGVSGNNAHPKLDPNEKERLAIPRVEGLVAKAVAYKDLAGSKEKLEQWLRNNGGQAVSGCILNFLLGDDSHASHFSQEPVGYVNPLFLADWALEDGKIAANFELVLSRITLATGHCLMATNDKVEVLDLSIPEEVDRFAAITKEHNELVEKDKPLPSVLQIKGAMTLEIDSEGKVVPRMSKCEVASYSDKLTSPAHLYLSPDKDKENTQTPVPK